MVRIFTRRKERSAAATCFLAVISFILMVNAVLGETQWKTCLETKKGIPSRIGKQIKHITLEMSPRITHQLSTHIFRIILQEELGYTRVNIVETGDYDAKTILQRMNCFNFSSTSTEEIIPEIMMNLEVPLAPDSDLLLADDECVKDMGTIGPSGSFGWFMPAQLGAAIKKYDPSWVNNSLDIHWREFRNQKYVKPFELTDKDLVQKIGKYMMDTKKKYFCNEPPCVEGWYIPDRCKNNPCALLLAPDFASTKSVISHINNMEVFVKVAWVGSNLRKVVDTVRQDYHRQLKTKTYKSFLILSWTPSDVIADVREFIKVTLPPCELLNGNSTDGCFYDKRRSVKVAWNDLKGDYSYEILKMMTFLDGNLYDKLFQTYLNYRDNLTISEIACKWLKTYDNISTQWIPKDYNVIHIGGIFPLSGSGYTGRGIVKGAAMAKEAINLNRTILPGYQIDVLVADSQCRADKVMKAFIDYLTGDMYKSMVGVLGPACSDTVEPLAGLSKYYKTITISYSAEGAFISDRDKYPYFMRTIGENKNYKYVYLELLRKLGWKRVAALTEDGQKYTEYISHMQDMLEAHDVTFISNTKFPRDREKDAMARYLEDLKRKRARIIIADVFDEIARNVMCEAYKLGMTAKQGYVWFLPTWLNSTWYNTTYYNHHLNESVNCTTANMIEAINGYFAMTHAFFGNDDDMMQENITVKQWREKYVNNTGGETSNYAGYAYDAVWTYALALDKLLKEDPNAVSNLHSTNATNKLTQIIKNIDFNGVSGRIKFRGGTSRFSIINIVQWYNNDTRVIGRYFPNISDSAPEIIGGYLDLNESAIVWLGNRIPDDGTPPPLECTLNALAKFLNVKCEMAIIILNVVVISILIVSLVSILIIIKVRYDRKVKNTKQYMKSLGLQHLLKVSNDYSGLDKWEVEREVIVLNRKLGEGAFGTVYGGEANLPNHGWCAIAVKTLKIGSSTEEKLDFLSEAEVMKRFDHKNVVKLLGVCTKLEPVYTIMEFMLYGDLKTYLLARRHLVNANTEDAEEVSSKKLTSMALDVARGLSYLAEMKYVHRDIASRNCLLNGQRIVKLGDFGMTRPMFENDYYKFNRRGMLPVRWMAPESLALGLFTPASDMWSYGVLLFEIITFGSFPFQGLTNTQVLDYVKNGNIVTIPQGVKAPLECLLKTCWNQDSKLRPTASEIVEYLANNSRLISPCLEVPAQSVQMEDTGQLEMQLPGQFRKCSSTLSFKNGLVNGISSMSIPSPARRKHSMQGDSGVSLQMENCCPKEPLLPTRSDSISGCSKYIQHATADSDYQDHEEITDFYPTSANNGHAISKV